MSEGRRGYEEPRRIERGVCRHGNKEATCSECLKDIEDAAESLRRSRKPKNPEEK